MAELADALVMDRSAVGHNLGPLGAAKDSSHEIEAKEDRRGDGMSR